MKYWVFLIVVFITSTAYSEPYIESISGDVKSGGEVIVYGSNFGSTGPNIILFDDFNRGSDGEGVSVNATVGEWDASPSFIFEDSALSNGKGARCVSDASWLVNKKKFDATPEVFMSSRVYVPDGYRFPYAKELKKMPEISALKHHWMYYGSNGYATDGQDIFGPNWTGANWHRVTSNKSKTYVYQQWGDPGWEWGYPVRWTHWVKGGNGPGVQPGQRGYFQGLNSSSHTAAHYDENNMGDQGWFRPDFPYAFDRISIPGYLRGTNGYPTDNYVIDDVYIAVGPGAAARVEIGNNPVYDNCTNLAISTVDNWGTGKIDFTLREGNFKQGETVYLFVIDADNNPSEGYPVILGETSKSPEPITLAPPGNLKVILN